MPDPTEFRKAQDVIGMLAGARHGDVASLEDGWALMGATRCSAPEAQGRVIRVDLRPSTLWTAGETWTNSTHLG